MKRGRGNIKHVKEPEILALEKIARSKRLKSVTLKEDEVLPAQLVRPKCWESFFRCQRNPILRSQLLTSLMAGKALQIERVPTAALLDAVLLASTARVYHEAEIVDDYRALLDRVSAEWARPDWTCKVFSSLHGNAANFIVTHGMTEFTCAEEQYIPAMVGWYLGQDVPAYFERELETDADLKRFHTSGIVDVPAPNEAVAEAYTAMLRGVRAKRLDLAGAPREVQEAALALYQNALAVHEVKRRAKKRAGKGSALPAKKRRVK